MQKQILCLLGTRALSVAFCFLAVGQGLSVATGLGSCFAVAQDQDLVPRTGTTPSTNTEPQARPATPVSIPQNSSAPADSSTQAGIQSGEPGMQLPPYLVKLNDAQFIDDSRFGEKSDTRLAFEQALKAGSSIRSELRWMVENGRPTGRIYAAIVFRSFDKPGGRELLERLRSDPNLIKYKKGGEICHYSVADVALDALSSKPIIGFGVDLATQR